MSERTEHGEERHHQEDRPTSEAFRDRENLREIYQDADSGFLIYVGSNGRTHVFTSDGRHHTSFRTTRQNRQRRLRSGRWIQNPQQD